MWEDTARTAPACPSCQPWLRPCPLIGAVLPVPSQQSTARSGCGGQDIHWELPATASSSAPTSTTRSHRTAPHRTAPHRTPRLCARAGSTTSSSPESPSMPPPRAPSPEPVPRTQPAPPGPAHRPRAAMPRCPGTALRRRQALPAPALATACGVTLLRAAWGRPGACGGGGGGRCRIPLGCRRRHQTFLLLSSSFLFVSYFSQMEMPGEGPLGRE